TAMGHRLCYVGVPSIQDAVERQGFAFTPYRVSEPVTPAVIDVICRKELPRILDAIKPDLAVVDSHTPTGGITAHHAGVPVVQYGAQLVSTFDPVVPPL